MLRFVALCFATALASASEYPAKNPEFGPVYSVRYDQTDLLAGTKLTYRLWYDETQNMSLLEHYGAQTLVGRAGANTGDGLLIFGYYVTTETYLNKWNCWNQSDFNLAFDFYFAYQRVEPLHSYTFIGKDVVRGEVADKWQLTYSYGSKNYEFTTWVTEKELDGSQQAVPLRHEVRTFYEDTGAMHRHYIQDFYDFNTSAISPEIFKSIKKDGVNCSTGFNPRPSGDQITTRFGQRSNLAWLTEHTIQDEMDPDIYRLHLMYPEALRGVGRWGPPGSLHPAGRAEGRRATVRGSTPRDSSQPSGALPFPYTDAEVEALSKDLPEEFDWRQHGAVTPVKDICTCFASYAFCARDLVAGAQYVQKNRTHLLRLSEQAIIDCSWEYNVGCHGFVSIGGTLEWIRNHGLPTELDYGEYQNENGYCNLANVKIAATISGVVEVPSDNENALKLAILNHGPVAVGISDTLYNGYGGGVYSDPDCKDGGDYGLVVGWGVLDKQKYWIIKFSHSHRWGVDGYALIAIDKNVCGVMNGPVYVTV